MSTKKFTAQSEGPGVPKTFCYHNSRLFALISLTNVFFSLQPARSPLLLSSSFLIAAFLWLFFNAATAPTNVWVQPNILASLLRVYVCGSERLSCLIFSTSSSDRRSSSGLLLRLGRLIGGNNGRGVPVFPSVVVSGLGFDDDWRRGDAGAVVSEKGEGAVGGGRCINVKFSSGSWVTTAFGLPSNGSGL